MRKSISVCESGTDKRASKFCNLTEKLLKELSTKGSRKLSLVKSDIEMGDFDSSKVVILDKLNQKLDEVIGLLDKL